MSAPESLQRTPGSPPLEDEVLPGYTAAREPREHLNSAPNRSGQPWLILRLLSEAPVGSKLPVYFSSSNVRGSAQVNLDSPQTIRCVTVEVSYPYMHMAHGCTDGTMTNLSKIRGKLCLATANSLPLLWHERKVLWESGGEHDPASITSAGSWKWDFSFPIPRRFDDSPNGGSKSAQLPSSFDMRPYIAFLEYHVFLFVKRGRWLPTEQELRTKFVYVVRERAPPPSPLRELAYSEQRAPPAPSDDPGGWESCNKFIANGVLFGDREVNVTYKPYLSKPSIYPRGGTIFYRIEVSSDDPQALQLMSSQSAISVTLTREIQSSPFGRAVQTVAGKKCLDIDVQTMAYGATWVNANSPGRSSDKFRVLEGEISIPSKTIPNLMVAVLELRYFVDFVVGATGFVPSNPSLAATKHPIRIVSHPALGVTPISRVPPGYEPTTVAHRVNINAVNVLSAGGAEWM